MTEDKASRLTVAYTPTPLGIAQIKAYDYTQTDAGVKSGASFEEMVQYYLAHPDETV